MQRPLLVPALLVASLVSAREIQGQAASSQIVIGQSVTGAIASSDPKMEDGSHYDSWRLRGQANQRVEIVLESADFDAYLKIAETSRDEPIDTDDDGAGGTDARMVVTLKDRDYVIWANTVAAGETGSYTLRVTALGPAAPPRPPAALTGNQANGRLDGGDPLADDDTFYDDYRYVAQARERVTIDLASADFDAYLEIGRMEDGAFESLKSNDDADSDAGTDARLVYTFPTAGEYVIRANTLTEGETGAYSLRLSSAGVGPAPPPAESRPIRSGQTITGVLSDDDPTADDDTHYDDYLYTGDAGERIIVDLASADFDSYLFLGQLTDGTFAALAENDDSQDGATSSTIVFTLPAAGQYVIRANSLGKASGSYTVAVRSLSR